MRKDWSVSLFHFFWPVCVVVPLENDFLLADIKCSLYAPVSPYCRLCLCRQHQPRSLRLFRIPPLKADAGSSVFCVCVETRATAAKWKGKTKMARFSSRNVFRLLIKKLKKNKKTGWLLFCLVIVVAKGRNQNAHRRVPRTRLPVRELGNSLSHTRRHDAEKTRE